MKNEITDIFKSKELNQERFNSIKITLASPDKIKSWSFGEIKRRRKSFVF